MPRVLLISNPLASGVTPRVEDRVIAILRESLDLELVRTTAPMHASELARSAGEGGEFDAVLVLAGDGTANEVLNGSAGRPLPIGLLPGGGTSVLARAMGIPRAGPRAAEQIAAAVLEGRTRHISLGVLNGRRFGFAAGVGFDAEAVRRVDARGRGRGRRPGDAFFALQIAELAANGRYRSPLATLETQGRVERVASIEVANVHPWSYVGARPIKLAPLALPEEGLELVAPRRMRRRDVPALFRYMIVDGAHAYVDDPRVAYFHDVREAVLTCDEPLPAQVDGDDVGDLVTVRLGVDTDGARLLV